LLREIMRRAGRGKQRALRTAGKAGRKALPVRD